MMIRANRPRLLAVLAVVLAVVGAIAADSVTAAPASLPGVSRGAAQQAAEAREGWVSWAIVDRRARTMALSANGNEPNNTESMIKAWIAADYMKDAQDNSRRLDQGELKQLTDMIHVSDNDAAQSLYKARGGDAVIERAISRCNLQYTTVTPGWWSLTQMPATDAARMADCIASPMGGLNAANRNYLLKLMRNVAPSDEFGITPLLQNRPAVKNGWTEHSKTGKWNLNCMAIFGENNRFAVVVETRYDRSLGQRYGEETCEKVARPLIPAKYRA